jgi:predicted HTH transcriptional regulator
MNLRELNSLIEKGEGLQLEFKHKIAFPDKIANEIVAFANTIGGILLVGVDDNKKIAGLKSVEEEIYAIKNLVKDFILLPVAYSYEIIAISPKKNILAVKILESKQKPNFSFDILFKTKTAYVRVADKSIKASSLMLKIMKLQQNDTYRSISLGKTEKDILQILDAQGFITLQQIQDQLFLSEKMASEILINLTLSNILKIEPTFSGDDRFLLKMVY